MFVIWSDVLHLLLHQDANSLLKCYHVRELGQDGTDAGSIGMGHNQDIADSIGLIPASNLGLDATRYWQHRPEKQSAPCWLLGVDSRPILCH